VVVNGVGTLWIDDIHLSKIWLKNFSYSIINFV
jgi:hypothetical protein